MGEEGEEGGSELQWFFEVEGEVTEVRGDEGEEGGEGRGRFCRLCEEVELERVEGAGRRREQRVEKRWRVLRLDLEEAELSEGEWEVW